MVQWTLKCLLLFGTLLQRNKVYFKKTWKLLDTFEALKLDDLGDKAEARDVLIVLDTWWLDSICNYGTILLM